MKVTADTITDEQVRELPGNKILVDAPWTELDSPNMEISVNDKGWPMYKVDGMEVSPFTFSMVVATVQCEWLRRIARNMRSE